MMSRSCSQGAEVTIVTGDVFLTEYIMFFFKCEPKSSQLKEPKT